MRKAPNFRGFFLRERKRVTDFKGKLARKEDYRLKNKGSLLWNYGMSMIKKEEKPER